MEKLKWNNEYSVGVEAMDAQHKRIIDMLNLLISDPDATVHSESISELLTKLTAYASEHFRAEENLLAKHEYPDLVSQQEEHQAYLFRVVEFCAEAEEHRDSVPAELMEFLMNWWKKHILESDMEYRAFFEELGLLSSEG